MKGIRIRCSRTNPCPLCGAMDYDMAIDYGDGDVVYWCHKLQDTGNVIVNGVEYVCIKAQKEIDTGVFNLYQEKGAYEAAREKSKKKWMEEQARTNPNWISRSPKSTKASAPAKAVTIIQKEVKQEVEPLSNAECNERYRFLLDNLCLEEKHEERLRKEWTSPCFPDIADRLLKKYPIRSLPPEDSVRFKGTEKFKNPSRKALVQKALKEFGDLRGLPGMFIRTQGSWAEKPENEAWTFVRGEGVIFPTYDIDGNLYRLRYREDYYTKEIKKDSSTRFMNDWGQFYHQYRNGEHLWYFKGANHAEPVLVYGEGVHKIELNEYGVPMLGKASNKYKTFSSSLLVDDGHYVRNRLKCGCSGGTPYSLYIPDRVKYSIVIGTEGEKKGMVASMIKGCPVLTNPGVGVYQQLFNSGNGTSVIEQLKERGMKVFVLCYDADKKENKSVAAAERGFIERLRQSGIRVFVGNWSGKFEKGLDDILLMGCEFSVDDPS